MTPEEKMAIDLAHGLPVCNLINEPDRQRWSISWDMPQFMKPYFSNVSRSARIQEKIVEKCQAAFNTGQIDVDSAEIIFSEMGLQIIVYPGVNGCYVCCKFYDDFSDHNIETASQAYALLNLFQTALREICECSVFWISDPEFCLDKERTDKTYVVTRPLHTKPISLWVASENFFNTQGLILARDSEEARVKAGNISPDLGIKPVFDFSDCSINGLLFFEVKVIFEDQKICPSQTLEVLAHDSDQAEYLAEESVSAWLSLSPIKQIIVPREGKPLLPGVLRR
ncbi:MAG: hypothetical protein WC536_00920 [Patescibacteria group bacterium]